MPGLNVRERLFCALAWIPKATVQAALAPLVVSKIQSKPDNEAFKPHGEIVVTLAVLAILLTAPLGSVLIAYFGPRLLRRATIPEQITLVSGVRDRGILGHLLFTCGVILWITRACSI